MLQMSPFPPFDDWRDKQGKMHPRTNACGRVGGPGYDLLITMDSAAMLERYSMCKTQAGVVNTREVIEPCFFRKIYLLIDRNADSGTFR
eukprot:4405099-Alexandrium_andersonii.AAC.1